MAIAEKMAANQKQIAISEFFEKNKHFLGFDSLPRSIITAVKESVDNSLDACEDSIDIPTVNIEGCDAYQRDFDGDGLVDATDPCPDSVENLCLEATIGAGDKESSTEARLLWTSLGLLILIAVLLLMMMFRKGKQGNSQPMIIQDYQQWK